MLCPKVIWPAAWHGALLLAILAVSGFLLGRPRGFDHGYATGTGEPTDEKYELRTYYVGDVAAWHRVDRTGQPIDPYEEMERLIQNSVGSIEWVIGDAYVKPDGETLSVVVFQTPNVHDQISDLFEQLRKVARANNVVLAPLVSLVPDASGPDTETRQ